jgi:hypothetical protein
MKKKVKHHKGSNRVIRGGNWNNEARNCRVSNRNNNSPEDRNNHIGFRLVLSPQLTGKPDGATEQLFALLPATGWDKKAATAARSADMSRLFAGSCSAPFFEQRNLSP